MKIDFVKTLEASAPYIPGRIYFEESTSLIKVATASNQYRVFGGVRSADYDSSTDILTIQNGNGDEIYIDFSQYVKQDEYEDDQYVVSVALSELNDKISELQSAYENMPETLYNYTKYFFNYVEYNSADKTIDFYNNTEGKLQSIDATDFIKDGMVNDVSIHNGTGANANVSCLVVTFNTDASTEDIEIPLTKIFNPSNYYDTSTADNRFVRKVTSTDNAVARFDGTDGSIQNSGVTITDSNNIVTPGALYLTSIASSVSSSTSRLYFGSTSSPYNYITANTSGVFGIYRASDNKGVSCYPDQNFFSTSNIDLGRSQSLWKNLYMSGTITDGTNTLTRPNKSGTIAVTSDIPTDASVAAWGYTKNALTGVSFNGVDASVTNGVASIVPIFDSAPTEDSSNFITSGAVYSTIADTEEVFASAINDIQTNLSSMSQEMDTVYDEIYSISNQMYGTLRNFQINGVTQQNTGNNADTVNFILDDVPTQDASYHGVSSAGLYNIITQNERVVAEVMNDLNDRLLAVEGIDVVDSSTVSNWGFTKNGLTGVSFNGVDASVTNGVASIIADVSGNVEIIEIIGVTPEDAEEEIIAVTAGTFARCAAVLDEGKTAILRFKPSANSHDALDYYVNTVNGSNNSYESIWFVDGNGYSSIGLFSNDTVEIVYNNFLRTETDPVFSASAAAGIASTDITNWNNKVSNVQADWNATTGLSAILNKPTIPSTLDQIVDGSTRKLSNFVLGSRSDSQVNYNDIAQVNALYDLPNGKLYALPNSDITGDSPELVDFILATTSDIPTDASVAGWGYIKSYTETDPTVPAWAKAANKPTYTASEVGALASGTTLDEIADGSTRKLANYLPRTGGIISSNNSTLSTGIEPGYIWVGDGNSSCTLDLNCIDRDLNSGDEVYTYYFPSKNGTFALTSDIPTDASIAAWGYIKTIVDASIAALGYTKNTGTLTGVKFNNTNATINGTVAEITATIPSTLDQIADGNTRKLSNYLPLAGGIMNADASLTFSDDSDYPLYQNIITAESIHMMDDEDGYELQIYSSLPGLKIGAVGLNTFTSFVYGGVVFRPANPGTTYNLQFPAKDGTFALTSDIPSAVTESTVSGWGFTKNTGTYSKPSGGIPKTDLASAVQTSLGKADTALQSFTETDPVFSTSAAAGITSSNITTWNGKQDAISDLATIRSNASAGAAKVSANNATITIQKGGTNVDSFTVNASSNKTINIPNELPTVTATDNGKVLRVVNGAWAAAIPITVYTGSNEPINSTGINGDIYIQS